MATRTWQTNLVLGRRFSRAWLCQTAHVIVSALDVVHKPAPVTQPPAEAVEAGLWRAMSVRMCVREGMCD